MGSSSERAVRGCCKGAGGGWSDCLLGPTRTSLAPAMAPHTMLLGWEWTRAVLSAECRWSVGTNGHWRES